MSLIISAFAPVGDVRKTWTPQLRTDLGATVLLLVDLGAGANRLGGSALAQVYGELGATPPDLAEPQRLTQLAAALAELRAQNLVLAYHDRSDGGVFATLVEMAFAGHCGLDVQLPPSANGAAGALFTEELGVVLQVKAEHAATVHSIFVRHGLGDDDARHRHRRRARCACVSKRRRHALDESWQDLRRAWSETSYRMRELRDEPSCAHEEFAAACDTGAPGLNVALTFDPNEDVAAPFIATARPKVAVLREQGVNSQIEMAAVFERVGFEAHDVHMTDVLVRPREAGRFPRPRRLRRILLRRRARRRRGLGEVDPVSRRRARAVPAVPRPSRHVHARRLQRLPDVRRAQGDHSRARERWPRFVRNRGEQFEGRFSLVELQPSPSIFLLGMDGSMLPIAVAHGEGRAEFASDEAAQGVLEERARVGALHRRRSQGRHALSGESQRLAVRHRGDHERRRARHADHAASGAVVPLRAEFLAAGRRG